jgi:hypothetical protein
MYFFQQGHIDNIQTFPRTVMVHYQINSKPEIDEVQ